MSGSCNEALPYVQEWLEDHARVVGGPPGCPGVVGSPFRKIERSARTSGNGRDTLPDVPEGWKAIPDDRQLSGVPPEYPGVVGSSSRMSGSGREAFLDTREWSVGLPDIWELSGSPHECPGVVGRPYRMSESDRETSRISGNGRRHSQLSSRGC